MPDPKRSRLRESEGMHFVISEVRSTPHRLATVPTPNSVMRTLINNDTTPLIVSEKMKNLRSQTSWLAKKWPFFAPADA